MPALDIADSPPAQFAAFRGPQTTIDLMRQQILGPRGERSVLVRSVTEHVIRHLQPKDYVSEIIAIRNFIAEKVRYVNDPVATEWCIDAQRLVEEILRHGKAAGDCDDGAGLGAVMCRQVGREVELVTVGFGVQNHFSHVFTRVREPKTKRWVVIDFVAGANESRMLSRVTTWKAWRID